MSCELTVTGNDILNSDDMSLRSTNKLTVTDNNILNSDDMSPRTSTNRSEQLEEINREVYD